MTDPSIVNAARDFVARVHGGCASVVGYAGNGFCWGWSVIGSAHPLLLQHGGIVAVQAVAATRGQQPTLNDLALAISSSVARACWKPLDSASITLVLQ